MTGRPAWLAPATPVHLFGVMGSFTVGTLLLIIWWLFLSRARWSDRLGGLALLIVVHAVAILLVHPSAEFVTLIPGIPWLCAVFVASLFFLGGPVIHGFAFVLLIGVVIGTYSSVFVASPAMLFWQNVLVARRRTRQSARRAKTVAGRSRA